MPVDWTYNLLDDARVLPFGDGHLKDKPEISFLLFIYALSYF